jgi:predicted transport protein
MSKSPEEQAASMIANLPEKTGRSLEAWKAAVADSGMEKHGQIVKWLKSEHGVTHGYANLIAQAFLNPSIGSSNGVDDGAALVEAQYAGKESLRPIYDRLRDKLAAFGDDVEFAPKKSYVSVRRSKQFAIIQPSTKTRVDVGIQNRGKPAGGRLEEAGKWNSMVTHRVRLSSLEDVDAALVGWLREAYESA